MYFRAVWHFTICPHPKHISHFPLTSVTMLFRAGTCLLLLSEHEYRRVRPHQSSRRSGRRKVGLESSRVWFCIPSVRIQDSRSTDTELLGCASRTSLEHGQRRLLHKTVPSDIFARNRSLLFAHLHLLEVDLGFHTTHEGLQHYDWNIKYWYRLCNLSTNAQE